MSDVKSIRGQFFTVNSRLQERMVSLLTPRDDWRVLEPSAGAGDLMRAVMSSYPEAQIIGWEIDSSVVSPDLPVAVGDFFQKAHSGERFHTIIGNPPYVAWKDVEESTRENARSVKAAYSNKANLYYLFVDRCIDLLEDGGELIFVQPKEWLYSTSAAPLREKILREGTITHIIDGGEEKVFPDADIPALMVFRFEKTRTAVHRVRCSKGIVVAGAWTTKTLSVSGEYWNLSEAARKPEDWLSVGDVFSAKVGIVSGADKIFRSDDSALEKEGTLRDFRTTRGIEKYIDVNDYDSFEDIPPHTAAYLEEHKDDLIGRRIVKFHEGNWWKFGAVRNKNHMENGGERIYVFMKTRTARPFFLDSGADYFTGALMALFPRVAVDLEKAVEFFNSDEFRGFCEDYGLLTSNKVSFQPKTLEALPFPTVL